MALPKVIFNIENGGLSRLTAAIGKVPGMVLTGNTVASKVKIGQSYQVFSLKEVENLGIEEEGTNAYAHKQIADFYKQAGEGAELWLMLVSDATTQEAMADVNEPYATKLLADAHGAIRVLALAKKATESPSLSNGIDADSEKAVIKAEELARHFENKYMPLRVLVAGNSFSGTAAELKNYQEADYSHVAMLLCNNDGTKSAGVGMILGRLTAIPTQRSIARVKDGIAEGLNAYFTNGKKVEEYTNAWETIHDKGYIFLRTFAGRAGFYFSDDQTLTSVKNDFSSLGRGLVMDEAMIIVCNTLTEYLSDEVLMTDDGKIHPAIIKNWQTDVERQLEGQMVAQGKLSSAACYIDDKQGVLANDKVVAVVRLQPVGYAKMIEIPIGFTTKTT